MISVTMAITERKADSLNAIKHTLFTAEDSQKCSDLESIAQMPHILNLLNIWLVYQQYPYNVLEWSCHIIHDICPFLIVLSCALYVT